MHRGLDNCLGLIYSVSGINSRGKFGDSLQKFPKPASFQKFRQIYGFGKKSVSARCSVMPFTWIKKGRMEKFLGWINLLIFL